MQNRDVVECVVDGEKTIVLVALVGPDGFSGWMYDPINGVKFVNVGLSPAPTHIDQVDYPVPAGSASKTLKEKMRTNVIRYARLRGLIEDVTAQEEAV